MARKDRNVAGGPGDVTEDAQGQDGELPSRAGAAWIDPTSRTPLFYAQQSERYGRQALIRDYEHRLNVNLIVVIDTVFAENLTYLEELLFDLSPDLPLHVLLASPGGDGEAAIRMVRAMQARCSRLVVLVPDMAKSAATLLCIGAHEIQMGPAGDLGPVDPQMVLGGRGLVSARRSLPLLTRPSNESKKIQIHSHCSHPCSAT